MTPPTFEPHLDPTAAHPAESMKKCRCGVVAFLDKTKGVCRDCWRVVTAVAEALASSRK